MSRALAPVAGALLAVLASGCGGVVTTEALAVTPAHLPLRAYPNVIIVPGPLEEDGQVARALARHLKKAGHTRVQVVAEGRLRQHTVGGHIAPAAVVVELLVATQERVHAQFGHRAQTTCDSLGCFEARSRNAQDVPVMRATLQVTVRDGRSMGVVQRMRLRALQASGSFENLKRDAVVALVRRLRLSTEQIPELIEVELLTVDLPDAERGIEAAEAGRWVSALSAFERAAADPGAARLSPVERARLAFDLGQAHRALGLGGEPARIEAALPHLRRARRLDPDNPRYRRLLARAGRDLRNAGLVRGQRIQAARNFRFAPARELASGPAPGKGRR